MSIKATFFTVFATLIVLLIVITVLTEQLIRTQAQIAVSENRRYESYKLADELRQSSDDLTRMARTYVVTADPRFERYFRDVLAIRNGEKPRPQDYHGIYWDFVAANGKQPRPDARAVSLETLMREMAFSEDELALLQEAQESSDTLVNLERVAMNAVKGRFDDGSGSFSVQGEPDLVLARNTMHGEAYHRAKAEIMGPIHEFFHRMEARTNEETSSLHARGRRYGQIGFTVSLVAVLVALGSFFLLNRRIVGPVRAVADRLEDIAAGEGDLTQRMPEGRQDEIGALSHGFNAFVGKTQDIMGEVASATQVVSTSATQIAASARQQEQTVMGFGRVTSDIAGAVTQISATSAELAGTMNEVSQAADQSADAASRGRVSLGEMETAMHGLIASTEAIAKKLGTMNEKADEISMVVEAINKVADQTNLLSVNAAIEAEKAGESGRGVLVVAREIRRLADQTGRSTLEIEDSVHQMQSAVSAGVMEMDKFGQEVRRGVDVVSSIGERLGQIIEQVEVLTDRFARVSEGMTQQSSGARQINASMTDLRSTARETVEALGEFTRSAYHLHQAVDSLQGEVQKFKLDE